MLTRCTASTKPGSWTVSSMGVVGDRRGHRAQAVAAAVEGEHPELLGEPDREVDPHRGHGVGRPEVVVGERRVEHDAGGAGHAARLPRVTGVHWARAFARHPHHQLVARLLGGPLRAHSTPTAAHGRPFCISGSPGQASSRGRSPRPLPRGHHRDQPTTPSSPTASHPPAQPAQADRPPHPRQPARRAAADDRRAAHRHLLLRHRRPARPDRHPRPGPPAHAGRGDEGAAARRRPRPGRGDPLRAERGAGAHRAVLPAGVHRLHRRAEPDDPVQGEGAATQPADPGLALHLPAADGRRHPALPRERGAGRRRPAPARRADPRPGDPLQPHLRARCSPSPRSPSRPSGRG